MAMTKRPHAVMLAFPTQGHITPMMQFAKILSARGFHITFVNTEYMQEKMLKSGSIQSMGGITFQTIPDGLPLQHGRTSQVEELCKSITNSCPPYFEKLIDKLMSSADVPPLSCIVYNGVMTWAQKSAKRLGIPGVSFWTASTCGFNIYFSIPLLVEKGYIPLKGLPQCSRQLESQLQLQNILSTVAMKREKTQLIIALISFVSTLVFTEIVCIAMGWCFFH